MKRLTAAAFVGKPPNLREENEAITARNKAEGLKIPLIDYVPLYVIDGQASGYTIKNSQFGESYCFDGEFTGVNLQTGEVGISTKCFLQRPVDQMLANELDKRTDGGVVTAKVKVGVKPHTGERGYEYVTEVSIKGMEDAVESKKLAALAAFGIDPTSLSKALPAPASAPTSKSKQMDIEEQAKPANEQEAKPAKKK
jgi:hypothetical protein